MVHKNLQPKQKIAAEINEKFTVAKLLAFFDYQNITAQDLEKLRNDLQSLGSELKVYKNSTVEKSFLNTEFYNEFAQHLNGQNIFLFSYEDAIASLKNIKTFLKNRKKNQLKLGIFQGKLVNGKELLAIAEIPGREQLLAMLASSLQGVLRNFMYALKSVAEKRE